MLLAKPFLGRWNFLGSIALAASRVAVASEPIARSDWLAVNFAKPLLGRRESFPYSSFCSHTFSITYLISFSVFPREQDTAVLVQQAREAGSGSTRSVKHSSNLP